MSFWIFVHKGESISAAITFPTLLEKKNWGFRSSPPTRSKIDSLRINDVVLFYIGGEHCKYFAGEARLTSDAHHPTRESIGGRDNYKIDAMVTFDNVDLWNSKRIYLTNRSVRERLGFITNKDNWGMSFAQSIISISPRDYEEIKKMLRERQQLVISKMCPKLEAVWKDGNRQ